MIKNIALVTALVAGLCLASLMTGCDHQHGSVLQDYTVTCTLDGKLQHDSATLLVLEQEYGKLRVCGSSRAQSGTFTFKGQIDEPKVALIRWDNDTVHPFHFVLEAGNITINIAPDKWRAGGSVLNAQYLDYMNRRNAIMNERVATWQEYLKAASSSSLTREEEQRMVRQDSLLNDSLQRMTVQRINRNDAVGRIIRERFAGQLDQEHARQLK